MFFGIILLAIGAVLLLQNLGFISGNMWNILWPCLIIAMGLSVLLKKKKWHSCCSKFFKHGEK
ncbi:MAG: hypothetical protein ISS87_00305 [Candidatus Pacebacteria bacterium]|nr:hypothetical protein [Candidatus Paceibacterota bacterium]